MGCSQSNTEIEFKSRKEKLGTNSNGKTDGKKNDATEIKVFNNSMIQGKTESISKSYVIIKRLGSGTFGKVYKVRHIQTGSLRAMKVVKRDTVNYQDDEKLFLKEIEILSQLDHPNVLKIYEYYIDDLNYYVMSELVSGGELYEQIYKIHNYNEKDAGIIMEQLFGAINYIHGKGIVHRDLKPENILLEAKKSKNLNVKIIDFGTSNYYSKGKKLNLKVGTPYYIAPEVLNKEYNNKCDVWSLGVIMYVLLSGSPPFDGSDDIEIMEKVQNGKFNFNGVEWETISQDAKNLILKLLKYDYKARISAEEAKADKWIVNILSNVEDKISYSVLKKPFENLRKFGAKQKLQQSTIAFLVHQLSNSEMVQDLRNIFKKLDINGDGTLSYDEIKVGFQNFYREEKIAEKEMEEILSKLDQDKSDTIEYEEFLRCTIDLDMLLTEQNLKMAFQAFDTDGSEELSPDEIKSALGVIEGNDDDGELIKNIIKEIDDNGDGTISFEEFKQLMVKVLKGE